MKYILLTICVIYQSRYSFQTQSSCNDVYSHANCKQLPEDDTCGPVSHSPRILGGKEAFLGQYPWMAIIFLIEVKLDGSSEIVLGCGGSIVTTRHVLTAAHCVPGSPYKLSHVRVGEYDLKSSKDCTADGVCAPVAKDIPTSHFVTHAKYETYSYTYDIALVYLESSIDFNKYVAPICLPIGKIFQSESILVTDTTFEVAGWGFINSTSQEKATVLQTVTVPYQPLSKCQEKFPRRQFIDKQLCAGGVKGEDSCRYDSGGPLMGHYSVDQSVERYFQVGIVSVGTAECGIGYPATYTKLSRFIAWILDNLDK